MRSFRLLQFGCLVAVAAIAAGLAGCVVAPARPVVYAPPPPLPPPHPLPAPGSYYPNGVVMVAPPPPIRKLSVIPLHQVISGLAGSGTGWAAAMSGLLDTGK